MPLLRRTLIAGSAAALGTFGWLAATAPTISAGLESAPAEEAEFIVPGAYEWTVPTGVVCANFDVYGADGGSGGDRVVDVDVDDAAPLADDQDGGSGGLGGRTTATIPVTPGEVITLTVGGYGQGGESVTPNSGPSVGGDNGGGNGGVGGENDGAGGGGGGGASDVRQGGTGFDDRVIVAGGGGGGGGAGFDASGTAGGGGGQPGEPGGNSVVSGEIQALEIQSGGQGGTATAGGAAGEQVGLSGLPTSGSFGQGGNGGQANNGGGGGGGGWYGGGGGAAGTGSDPGAGGGGGSSYGPAGATFQTGVGATNDNNGLIIVRWTPNDTSCQAVAPAAVVSDPTFTG